MTKADRKAKAIKLWEQGLSTPSIAERFGVTVGTVGLWLKQAGHKPDGRRRFDGEGVARRAGRISADRKGLAAHA